MNDAKKLRVTTLPTRSTEYFQSWKLTPNDIKEGFAQAQNGYPQKFYDIIEKILPIDGHLSGDLQTRKDDILGLPWGITGDNAQQVEFVKSIIERLGYYALSEVFLDSAFWGFKVIELDWDSDGKYVYPFHFYALDNKYFKSASVENINVIPRSIKDVLIHITGAGEEKAIRESEQGKFIVADYSVVNYRRLPVNFTKLGIAPACIFYSLIKFYNIQDWGAYNEKFGMPHVDGTYPDDAKQETIDAIEECVHSFASDGSGVRPESTALNLIENKSSGSGDTYDKLIVRANKEQSKIVLSAAELSELGDKGARASTQKQDDLRVLKKISDIRYVEELYNKELIPLLLVPNFAQPDPTIKLTVKYTPPKDLVQILQVAREAYDMGHAIPVSWIAKELGIPETVGDEPVLKKTPQSGLGALLGA